MIGKPVLTRSLVQRIFEQQGLSIFAMPALFLVLLIVLTAIVHYFPILLTGPTKSALKASAQSQFGMSPGDTAALTLTFVLVQAPYLLGLFAAASASRNVQTLFKSELDRGGLELLLSMPYSARQVLGSLLLAALLITVISWSIIAFVGYAIIGATLYASGAAEADLAAFLLVAFLVSLSCALWSALATLLFSAWLPKLMSVGTGATNGISRFVAITPALIMFIGLNLMPAVHLPMFALWTLVLGFGAVFLLMGILSRLMRVELFLSST